jgi:hypothetical protein
MRAGWDRTYPDVAGGPHISSHPRGRMAAGAAV